MNQLDVSIEDRIVGRFTRQDRGASFQYAENVDPRDAVSLEMPVRSEPYQHFFGMLPAFDTNVPEGRLLESLRAALAKTVSGCTDPIDVLRLTGGNQIGRVRILPIGETPERRQEIENLESLLNQQVNAHLIRAIFDKYALRSGVSGAMPKVLAEISSEPVEVRTTIQARNVILKFDDRDYPGLSLNEFYAMKAAQAAGNETADLHLSKDGRMLVVERFDEVDGHRIGFEDLCSLNGKTSDQKYQGSVETGLFKTVAKHSGIHRQENLERLFRLTVTNIALRNGDAHLKNFGLLYDDPSSGNARLTPSYDIVTTSVYIKDDLMSLSLAGTTRWPSRDKLVELGKRANLDAKAASSIIDEVGAGIRLVIPQMISDLTSRGHEELAQNMAKEWRDGLQASIDMDVP